MVQRFVTFLLVFILLHLRDCCTAHTRQDMKKTVSADHGMVGLDFETARRSSENVEEVFYDGIPTGAEVEKTMLRGRKMIMSERILGKEIMKEEVSSQKDSTISCAAHSTVGHCNHRRKGILKVECKLRNRKHSTDRKVKMAGFTAFSADYHVPKSHPPRNN